MRVLPVEVAMIGLTSRRYGSGPHRHTQDWKWHRSGIGWRGAQRPRAKSQKPSESIFFFPHGPRAGHIPSHHQNKPLMRKFACVLHALLIRYKRKGPASPKSCPLTGFRSQAALSPFFDNPLDSSQQPEPRHIIFGAAGAKASPLIGGDALPHRCVTRLRRFPATHCNHIDLHPRPKM